MPGTSSHDWEDFFRLSERVLQDLREHAFVGDRAGDSVLQFLQLPSFDSWTCWELLHGFDSGSSRFAAVRIVWLRRADEEAFMNPISRVARGFPFRPQIEVRAAPVASDDAGPLLDRLSQTRCPVCSTEKHVYLDGTRYEFACTNSALAVRVSWHEHLPCGCSELAECMDLFTSMCDRSIEASG